MARMTGQARKAGVPVRRIYLVVAIERFRARLQLVQFKVDVSAADVIVGDLEEHLSDPVVERLGFVRNRYPVYPIAQHVAEKLHALTLPRDVDNTRARDLVDLAWFRQHFTFRSETLIDACRATFDRRATHDWPPRVPVPPPDHRPPCQCSPQRRSIGEARRARKCGPGSGEIVEGWARVTPRCASP